MEMAGVISGTQSQSGRKVFRITTNIYLFPIIFLKIFMSISFIGNHRETAYDSTNVILRKSGRSISIRVTRRFFDRLVRSKIYDVYKI